MPPPRQTGTLIRRTRTRSSEQARGLLESTDSRVSGDKIGVCSELPNDQPHDAGVSVTSRRRDAARRRTH